MKHLIILLAILIIISIFHVNLTQMEGFSSLLYPTKGLTKECKALGLKPAFMPSSCIKKNGYFNNHRNCKCVDNEGYCAICYPETNHVGLEIAGYTTGEEYGNVVQQNT